MSTDEPCLHGRVLVEREGQLDSLEANLAEAVRGHGRLIFIGGEAGVGKTTLTSQFAAHVNGVRVLRGIADSPSTPAPLGPFLDAFTGSATGLEDLLGTRTRLFPAVRSALAETPTLLVLEDLHWSDQATLDLLGHLGRRLDGVPALILVTYRDDEVNGAHPLTTVLGDLATHAGVARMHVPPLTRDAVRRLAEEAAAHVDVDELYRRTAGNSFFVAEVLAADAGSLPPSVRDAALARAARLSAAGRRVLDAMAVLGGGVELDLLRDVSGQPLAAVDECCERGMLVGDVRLEFRHEFAREAIEQAMPAATRAGLHAAALAWLKDAGTVDDRRIARHAEACGNAAAVVIHAPRAGDRAARLGAHREAAAHYRTARQYGFLLAGPDRAALLERLSYECYLTDELQGAADAQAEALDAHRLGDDGRRIGSALRWLSRLSWFLGRNADSQRYAIEALSTLEPLGAVPELAMAYSNLSQLRMLSDDTSGAQHWGGKALELAQTFGDQEARSHALNNMGSALMLAGQLAEGSAVLGRSLDIALAGDAHEHVARAYTNLGSSYVQHRRFTDADRHLRAGIDYCVERDLDSWRFYMQAWLARSLSEQGRWDAARQGAGDVLRQPHLSAISRIPALLVSAQIAVRRGMSGADGALDEALRLAERTGEAQRVIPVVLTRAEAAWTTGRSIAVELTRARSLVSADRWDLGELAWWTQRAGLSEPAPTSCAEPFALMLSGRAVDAAAAWAEVGVPMWQALALVTSDRAGDVRDGVEMLRSLGAEATVHAVLRDLHAMGKPVPRGPRPSSRAHPAGLTHRELEVLVLLRDGLSNADIAAQLYLSVKTVGHHVSAVLRKLGEPTRSRAVATAARHGLLPR